MSRTKPRKGSALRGQLRSSVAIHGTLLLLALLIGVLSPSPALAFVADRLSFSVRVKDEVSSHRVLGVFVAPGEELEIEVLDGSQSPIGYRLEVTAGSVDGGTTGRWTWHTPAAKGLHPLRIVRAGSREVMILNVFVTVPYQKLEGEQLSGYRIGSYPQMPFRGLSIYLPPPGFVEVTSENRTVPVSPHFTLGQFVCKQAGGYPKYVVLRERLLLKLELLLERMNEQGYAAETFHVMSGYRTPSYNKGIGNVKYSRHIYGDAADIFIDERPRDGMMDDLNGDGSIDAADADILRDTVEEMVPKPWYEPFIGGLGRYQKKSHRGPFVHVDTRGFRARWNS